MMHFQVCGYHTLPREKREGEKLEQQREISERLLGVLVLMSNLIVWNSDKILGKKSCYKDSEIQKMRQEEYQKINQQLKDMEKEICETITWEDAEWEGMKKMKNYLELDLDTVTLARGSRYLFWTSRELIKIIHELHEKMKKIGYEYLEIKNHEETGAAGLLVMNPNEQGGTTAGEQFCIECWKSTME